MQQPTSGSVPIAVIPSAYADSVRMLSTSGAPHASVSHYRQMLRRAAAQAGNTSIEGVSA